MQVDEIKIRVSKYANDLIMRIFPETDVFSKFKSTALEYWVKQNVWRLDDVLNNFVDKTGEIDIPEAIDFFADSLFDANGWLTINIQERFRGSMIAKYLPDQVIVFTKDDLYHMFNISHEAYSMDHSNPLNSNRNTK